MEKCVSKVNPTVVLCVDDDPAGLFARRLMLTLAGYDVLTAPSGDVALRVFRRRNVDLVITDHFLPGGTGVEIAVSMKQMKPQVLVVLLIGRPELPPGAEQADLVLIKGMEPPKFLEAIAKLLARRQSSARQSDGES
jgi:DNA-binding response OmpR family regulator